MNKRGNVALWASLLIGALLVLGIGIGIRYYNQKQEKPALENKQVPLTQQPKLEEPKPLVEDKTKDWKTYRNDLYGFEFKYPPEWDSGAEPPYYAKKPYHDIKIAKYENASDDPNSFGMLKSEYDNLRENIDRDKSTLLLNSKPARLSTEFTAEGGVFFKKLEFFIGKDYVSIAVILPLGIISQNDRTKDPNLVQRTIQNIKIRNVDENTLQSIRDFDTLLTTITFRSF